MVREYEKCIQLYRSKIGEFMKNFRKKLGYFLNDLNWPFYKRRDKNKFYRVVFNSFERFIQFVE